MPLISWQKLRKIVTLVTWKYTKNESDAHETIKIKTKKDEIELAKQLSNEIEEPEKQKQKQKPKNNNKNDNDNDEMSNEKSSALTHIYTHTHTHTTIPTCIMVLQKMRFCA